MQTSFFEEEYFDYPEIQPSEFRDEKEGYWVRHYEYGYDANGNCGGPLDGTELFQEFIDKNIAWCKKNGGVRHLWIDRKKKSGEWVSVVYYAHGKQLSKPLEFKTHMEAMGFAW